MQSKTSLCGITYYIDNCTSLPIWFLYWKQSSILHNPELRGSLCDMHFWTASCEDTEDSRCHSSTLSDHINVSCYFSVETSLMHAVCTYHYVTFQRQGISGTCSIDIYSCFFYGCGSSGHTCHGSALTWWFFEKSPGVNTEARKRTPETAVSSSPHLPSEDKPKAPFWTHTEANFGLGSFLKEARLMWSVSAPQGAPVLISFTICNLVW